MMIMIILGMGWRVVGAGRRGEDLLSHLSSLVLHVLNVEQKPVHADHTQERLCVTSSRQTVASIILRV